MHTNQELQPIACEQKFKTTGLLFTIYKGALSPEDTLLQDFDKVKEPWSGYLCHPKTELDMTGVEGVFSIDKTFAFYTSCIQCDHKEQFLTHDDCFYCFHKLGPEVLQDNLADYFQNTPASAHQVSLKTCPHCHRTFAWYRVNLEQEIFGD